MPAYGTIANAPALYPGEQQALVNNAANDSNVTQTQQVSIPQSVDDPAGTLTLFNSSNQTATVNVASADTGAAAYLPLTDADTAQAITVAAGKAIVFRYKGGFLMCSYATAPTTGSLILAR